MYEIHSLQIITKFLELVLLGHDVLLRIFPLHKFSWYGAVVFSFYVSFFMFVLVVTHFVKNWEIPFFFPNILDC